MNIKTDHMEWLRSVGEMSAVVNNPYSWAYQRIRDLEAQLAEARKDGERIRWYLDCENGQVVGGLELQWLLEPECLTYDRWAKDIDDAMKGGETDA